MHFIDIGFIMWFFEM